MDNPEKLTVDEAEERVVEVHNLAQAGDPEDAHAHERRLHTDVLKAIAAGARNPRSLAIAALKTRKIDFGQPAPVRLNDTLGEVTAAEHQELRDSALPCLKCGLTATIDPVFHEDRYGHAPQYHDEDGKTIVWVAGEWIGPDENLSGGGARWRRAVGLSW